MFGKKTTGHWADINGRVYVRDETPSRAAMKAASGRHGDFVKDGLGSRLFDALANKVKGKK